jgi:hypothetical protein
MAEARGARRVWLPPRSVRSALGNRARRHRERRVDKRGAGVTLAGVELEGLLGDFVFLGITVAFFGLAWLLVRLCERIAGASEIVAVIESDGEAPVGTRVAA